MKDCRFAATLRSGQVTEAGETLEELFFSITEGQPKEGGDAK